MPLYATSKFNIGLIKGHLSQVIGLIKGKNLKGAMAHLDKHVPRPVVSALHGQVYRIEKEAGRPTGHRDFGRVALRNSDGWNVSDDVRISAIEKIQALLPELLPEMPKSEKLKQRESLLSKYKVQLIEVQTLLAAGVEDQTTKAVELFNRLFGSEVANAAAPQDAETVKQKVQALTNIQDDVKRLHSLWPTLDKVGEIHARAEAVHRVSATGAFEREDASKFGNSCALLVAAYLRKYPFLDFYFEPLQPLLDADIEAEYESVDSRDKVKKDPILRQMFEQQTSICRKPENESLNGFDSVKIFDATLVPLSTKRFINANLVSLMGRPFIGTQAPLEPTVEDFWQMVLEQKPPCIAAVNESFDDPKEVFAYCPNEVGEIKRFGDITVQLKEPITLESHADWRILGYAEVHGIKQRKLIVTKGDLVHELDHFQYLHWPDGHFPSEPCVLRLLELVAASQQNNKNPFVVHCRAGVGRAGLFMVLYDQWMRCKSGMPLDIKKSVLDLRDPAKGRSLSMLANFSQYEFVYHFLQNAIL